MQKVKVQVHFLPFLLLHRQKKKKRKKKGNCYEFTSVEGISKRF